MNNPLVSILMPAKNAGPYLRACLDSIVGQTYTKWELLVVNDHSEDDTNRILTEYAVKDPRIKVLQNEGKGIIHALRLAYSHSHGQLISRMDADDIMLPEKLAVLAGNLLKEGLGHLATGQVEYFSETTLGAGYKAYADWLNSLTGKGTNFQDIYKECVIPSPCWMVHRHDLDAADAFSLDRYLEDYDLCFRFYQQGLQVIPCTQVLHRWRDYASRSSRTDAHYADNRFIQIKVHYLLKLHYDNKRPLVVWGAGKKGKAIAKELLAANVPFRWLCNNPEKIGKDIYGHRLESTESLGDISDRQLIIAVAAKADQADITGWLQVRNLQPLQDYFFFC